MQSPRLTSKTAPAAPTLSGKGPQADSGLAIRTGPLQLPGCERECEHDGMEEIRTRERNSGIEDGWNERGFGGWSVSSIKSGQVPRWGFVFVVCCCCCCSFSSVYYVVHFNLFAC